MCNQTYFLGGSPSGTPSREMPNLSGIDTSHERSMLYRSLLDSYRLNTVEIELEKVKEREKENDAIFRIFGIDRRQDQRER